MKRLVEAERIVARPGAACQRRKMAEVDVIVAGLPFGQLRPVIGMTTRIGIVVGTRRNLNQRTGERLAAREAEFDRSDPLVAARVGRIINIEQIGERIRGNRPFAYGAALVVTQLERAPCRPLLDLGTPGRSRQSRYHDGRRTRRCAYCRGVFPLRIATRTHTSIAVAAAGARKERRKNDQQQTSSPTGISLNQCHL